MSKGSFFGSVAKTILVGLVASYAIRYIQNRLDAMHENRGDDEEDAGTDSDTEKLKGAKSAPVNA